jgi:ubiquinone/menaquinone biosynthesis C-methylase UbiE
MKINEFYDKYARDYENLLADPRFNAQHVIKAKELFYKYEITEGTILDVACGPGNLKTALGDKFVYTGIDISEKMLVEAAKKGYEVIRGKMEDELLKFPDKSFDYVVSLSALHFVKDIDLVISQFDRIAKKGWLISLADITENYMKNLPIKEPMYNHSKLNIDTAGVKEDIYFLAWTSPTTGEKIYEREVFKFF